METFAEYILNEKDFAKKAEIAYYLHKKKGTYFDNSVIYKAMVAKTFIDSMDIDVDSNLVTTAMLLCGCKKINNSQDIERIKAYAKEGAQYLQSLGFSKEFCNICEQQNRYSNLLPRTKEGDILELADNFGGMMLDRPERRGFPIDEALVLIEYRNLKGLDNQYLSKFKEFINIEKEII